jgi:hypothetical protein
VKGIPWDTIIKDCDEGEKVPPLIEGEFSAGATSSVQLLRNRDNETWTSEYRQHVLELVKPLLYWSNSNIKFEDISQGFWFNRYKKGGRALPHYHSDLVDLVVVWYIKATPSMGKFVYQYQGHEHTIEVSTGDLLIFPGTLVHWSEENTSDEERFLMANNICLSRYMDQKINKLIRLRVDKEAVNKLYSTRQEELYKLLEQL